MQVVTQIKVDKDLKEKTRKIADEMGMPLSELVSKILENFVAGRGVEEMVSEYRTKIGTHHTLYGN